MVQFNSVNLFLTHTVSVLTAIPAVHATKRRMSKGINVIFHKHCVQEIWRKNKQKGNIIHYHQHWLTLTRFEYPV